MQNKFFIMIIFSFLALSCKEHKKQTIILKESNLSIPVQYKTDLVDFYFEKEDLVGYCNKEDNGEDNDFTFVQILEYLNSHDTIPIFIPDTLGTKMAKERDIRFNDIDSFIRVRDQAHPYAYITDDIRWAIIDFAQKGKIKIFERLSEKWIDTIVVDKVDTDWYGETNITLTNDSIVFSQLRWIR